MIPTQELPTLTFERRRYQAAKICPCGKSNRDGKFVPYQGFENKGYCHSCGETFLPEIEANATATLQLRRAVKPEPSKLIQYVPAEVLKRTQRAYERNSFVTFLRTLFDSEKVNTLIEMYRLGTAKDGSCIFWQIDSAGQVRTGKAIGYGPDGHRNRNIYFIHTRLKIEAIEQCLFGLHLLSDKPVALVESEKTAVMCGGVYPEYTWMATGGKTNLSKVHALKGRKVIAIPDTDAYHEWTQRLAPYGFEISSFLQSVVPESLWGEGYDLADFITKAENYFETLNDGRTIEMHPMEYPASWNA